MASGLAETAKLVSSLELNTSKFDTGVAKASTSLRRLEGTSFKVGQNIGKGLSTAAGNIKKIAVGGAIALAGAVALGVKSLGDLQRSQAQTAAVIQSTGGKAKVSAEQVRALAEAQEDLTTVDDKVIQDGENLLLTFTNIGSTVFPEATKAMTNLAIAMAGGNVEQVDLKSSAIQLGKALNDPAKGYTALKRAGVSFDAAQEKILKGSATLNKEEQKHYAQLLKTDKREAKRYARTTLANKQIAAQKLILAELNKEFGKAGEAAGTGPEAVWRRLQDAGEGLSQVLARGVLPALERVGKFLTEKLQDKAFLAQVDAFGQRLGTAVDKFLAFIQTVDFNAIGAALGIAADAAGTLVGWFLAMPAWVQTAVLTGWGLNKLTGGMLTDIFGTLAQGLIKGVLGMNAAVVNINAGTVVGAGGGPAGWSPTSGAGGGLTGLVKGLPIIGAAIAGAEFANIAGNIIADKIKEAAPGSQEGGDFGSGVVKVLTGALTGAIGIPTLVGGLQDVAGAIGNIIPLIGRNPPKGSLDRPQNVGPGGDRDAEAQRKATEAVQTEVEATKAKVADELANVQTDVQYAGRATSAAARAAGVTAALASAAAGFGIEAAIRANRPITNVDINISATTVRETVNVTDRYGEPTGSRKGQPGMGD